MEKLNYEKVFNTLVNETAEYMISHKLKAMVLGISGGIDSTVVSAICYEVSRKTGIPLIGASLPIKNKNDEFSISKLVGEVFCNEFHVRNLRLSYKASLIDSILEIDTTPQDSHEGELMMEYTISQLENWNGRTPIANGNLQARCRNHFIYDLAGINRGIVMSTDNQSEWQLGFWTRHGDEGDYDPIQDLWKTEVYELAKWLLNIYDINRNPLVNDAGGAMWNEKAYQAMKKSIELPPTDGLGISNTDLDQIGAKGYDEVDEILQRLIPYEKYRKKFETLSMHDEIAESDCLEALSRKFGNDVVENVWNRHVNSEFKREKSPISISRSKYE